MGPTRQLADWVAGLDLAAVPDHVVHEARRCLVDWLGVTVAGSRDPAATPMRTVVGDVGGEGPASVLGSDLHTTPPYAALANGYYAHIHDYDDTFLPGRTTVHPSAPLWPALVAMSESRPVDGEMALRAFIAGFETENRIALAAGPSHYERGWHVTGTVGHLGAAAAVANLLGLREPGVTAALGTAGTQAAGLKEVYGSMGKPLHPGKAAMDGLLSALLVEAGFTSTTTILEGDRGVLAVMSDDPDVAALTDRLGETWTLPENGYKPYACGSLMHPAMEAVIRIRDEHDLPPGVVEEITAAVHDYVSWVTAKEEPTTGLEGKFSIYHALAVAMVDGAARLEQFTDERVNAPEVLDMRARVRIVVDDASPKEAARVTIRTTDGDEHEAYVPANKGTFANPMTDDELMDKAVDLIAPTTGEAAARSLVRRCLELDASMNLEEIPQAVQAAR